ncbi:MAG: ABC transporter ATP-binding protein [Actinomycetota bacterium]
MTAQAARDVGVTGAMLLELDSLNVRFPTEDGVVRAVGGVSLAVREGETLGVVGESGSGKSVTFLTVLGLVTKAQADISGTIDFRGQDLLQQPEDELRSIRGNDIAMIFQDPLTALNPVLRVGDQIAEVFLAHQKMSKAEAMAQSVELLDLVGIPKPKERSRQYPHEFSGGMRQRAMIAMALALKPALLIADEPTTALDVTVQAQILELIDRMKDEFGMSVVLITHDLGVVAEHCDSIAVMYAGKVIEYGDRDDIYYRSEHPYTWGLLNSIPRLGEGADRLEPIRGLPPSLINLPPGCSFHPRCPYRFEPCDKEIPALLPSDGHHASACHLPLEEKQRIFSERVVATG